MQGVGFVSGGAAGGNMFTEPKIMYTGQYFYRLVTYGDKRYWEYELRTDGVLTIQEGLTYKGDVMAIGAGGNGVSVNTSAPGGGGGGGAGYPAYKSAVVLTGTIPVIVGQHSGQSSVLGTVSALGGQSSTGSVPAGGYLGPYYLYNDTELPAGIATAATAGTANEFYTSIHWFEDDVPMQIASAAGHGGSGANGCVVDRLLCPTASNGRYGSLSTKELSYGSPGTVMVPDAAGKGGKGYGAGAGGSGGVCDMSHAPAPTNISVEAAKGAPGVVLIRLEAGKVAGGGTGSGAQIVRVANATELPAEGSLNALYLVEADRAIYFYTASGYVPITGSEAVFDVISGGTV